LGRILRIDPCKGIHAHRRCIKRISFPVSGILHAKVTHDLFVVDSKFEFPIQEKSACAGVFSISELYISGCFKKSIICELKSGVGLKSLRMLRSKGLGIRVRAPRSTLGILHPLKSLILIIAVKFNWEGECIRGIRAIYFFLNSVPVTHGPVYEDTRCAIGIGWTLETDRLTVLGI
jgi:hypothetical protein